MGCGKFLYKNKAAVEKHIVCSVIEKWTGGPEASHAFESPGQCCNTKGLWGPIPECCIHRIKGAAQGCAF